MARLTTFETASKWRRLTSAIRCRRIWWWEWLRAVSSPMPFTPAFIAGTGRTSFHIPGNTFAHVISVDLRGTHLILRFNGRLFAPLEKPARILQNGFEFNWWRITTWKSNNCTTYAICKYQNIFRKLCLDDVENNPDVGGDGHYHYHTSINLKRCWNWIDHGGHIEG